jgi:hypothetical protein
MRGKIEVNAGSRMQMVTFLKFMLPLLLLVLVLMGLWLSVLHFPWQWITYLVMGVEIFTATIVFSMEYQAQHIGGASGWGSFGWLGFNVCLAMLLGLCRIVIWLYQRLEFQF